jgi:hypothetical protein
MYKSKINHIIPQCASENAFNTKNTREIIDWFQNQSLGILKIRKTNVSETDLLPSSGEGRETLLIWVP